MPKQRRPADAAGLNNTLQCTCRPHPPVLAAGRQSGSGRVGSTAKLVNDHTKEFVICTFFRGSRRKTGLLMLLFLLAGCSSRTTQQEIIESEAIEAIDYSQLDRTVLDFIERAKSKDLIGQDASKFIEVLNASTRRRTEGSNDKRESYMLILPSTQGTLDRLKQVHFTDCWPSLWVDVDPQTAKIILVRICVQCL